MEKIWEYFTDEVARFAQKFFKGLVWLPAIVAGLLGAVLSFGLAISLLNVTSDIFDTRVLGGATDTAPIVTLVRKLPEWTARGAQWIIDAFQDREPQGGTYQLPTSGVLINDEQAAVERYQTFAIGMPVSFTTREPVPMYEQPNTSPQYIVGTWDVSANPTVPIYVRVLFTNGEEWVRINAEGHPDGPLWIQTRYIKAEQLPDYPLVIDPWGEIPSQLGPLVQDEYALEIWKEFRDETQVVTPKVLEALSVLSTNVEGEWGYIEERLQEAYTTAEEIERNLTQGLSVEDVSSTNVSLRVDILSVEPLQGRFLFFKVDDGTHTARLLSLTSLNGEWYALRDEYEVSVGNLRRSGFRNIKENSVLLEFTVTE